MVPRLSINSWRDMPIPLSETDRVPASLSHVMPIFRSASPSSNSGFANASKRSLSAASEAFDMSSPANQLSDPAELAANGIADEPIMRAVRMMW